MSSHKGRIRCSDAAFDIWPLSIISAVSFFFVGKQLSFNAEKRLRQQCRHNGLQIFERLIVLEDYLAWAGQKVVQGTTTDIKKEPFDPLTRQGSGFRRLFVLSKGQTIPILDNLAGVRVPSLENIALPEKEKTTICIFYIDQAPALYMVKRLPVEMPGKWGIAAEIDPVFLWGLGSEGTASTDIELTVITSAEEKLISSLQDFHVDADFLAAHRQKSFSGTYENRIGGSDFYIHAYWSLFLNHRFDSPDWIIVSSQSRASIMEPVSSFTSTFFLLLLLTFWTILLLSIHTIRKRTTPIETLKAGAMKIAHGEFGHHVEISSGDEFESLAEAFNEMSDKIKQSQAMLLQAAKMSVFGQMGAGIVHEIGQPLSAISGYADLLRMGAAPEKGKRYLSIICQQIERLRTIVAKFRTFSRSSDEVRVEVNMNDILEKTLSLLEHPLKMKKVEIEWGKADDLPSILGNEDELQQVFLNLLSNAADALEEKSSGPRRIEIRSHATDGEAIVEIMDNGSGIPKEIQESIFDPFFTTKGKEKGTGLGLAVTRSIVEKHNGKIELISAPDEGTTFKLFFPRSTVSQLPK